MNINRIKWISEEEKEKEEDDSPKITDNITNDNINSIISTLQSYISELENERLSYKARTLEKCIDYLEKIKN